MNSNYLMNINDLMNINEFITDLFNISYWIPFIEHKKPACNETLQNHYNSFKSVTEDTCRLQLIEG